MLTRQPPCSWVRGWFHSPATVPSGCPEAARSTSESAESVAWTLPLDDGGTQAVPCPLASSPISPGERAGGDGPSLGLPRGCQLSGSYLSAAGLGPRRASCQEQEHCCIFTTLFLPLVSPHYRQCSTFPGVFRC